MMKRYLIILFLILVAVCSGYARTPESTPVLTGVQVLAEWDYSGGILNRDEVLKKAALVTGETYPDAPCVELALIVKILYNADGTYLTWNDSYYKYLSERAISDAPVISLSFTIPHQRGSEDCKFTLVEIIKPDGTVVSIDPEEESTVKTDRSKMDNNIYSQDKKIVEVGLPGLEVGDIIHFVSFERTVEPNLPDNYAAGWMIQNFYPLLYHVIEICGPEELPLRSMIIKDKIEGTVTESKRREGGLICYRWEWKDVPSIFPEPNMPPLISVKQRLLVSTLPDWKALSRWVSDMYEPHLQSDREIKAKVKDLTKGLEDPGKKIEALFLFVSQKIGYLGMAAEVSDPGLRPHDVSATFKNRMGICRDQAALLVAMLREAGFEAFPVIISVHKKMDPEVPLPHGIDHVIAAVRQENGEYLLMDPTGETTSAFISPLLNNRNYLVATPEGETLFTSPPTPSQNNTLEINTTGKIDRAGNLTAETVIDFNGVNDAFYRSRYAKVRLADLFRFFQDKILKDIDGVSLNELVCEPEDLTDTSHPLTIRFKYKAENFLIRGGDVVMIPLPSLASKIGWVNELIDNCGLKKRLYPLVNKVTCGVRERITLDLDQAVGEAEALPSTEPIEDDTISWKLSSQMKGSELIVESDFRLKIPEFTPEEYLALRNTIQAAERGRRQMAIFAPVSEDTPILEDIPVVTPSPPADTSSGKSTGFEQAASSSGVIFLHKRLEYNLEDAYNWTETISEKKQILSYSGIKSEGLLEIYNPYQGEVKIEKAVVTGPDGSSMEVGEENISRYPIKLVVAFPGLEVGSTIDYRYTIKARDRIFAEGVQFIAIDPTREIAVILRTPRDLPVSIVINNFEGVLSSEIPDPEDPSRLVYEWKYENIPLLKPEDSMPPSWTFKPSLYISTGNWDDYASRVEKTLTDAAGKTTLHKTDASPREIVRVARDYVDRKIRIHGSTLPPFTSVTSVGQTRKGGSNSLVDRAVLIYGLLEMAGLKPQFVLASSFPHLKEINQILTTAPYPELFMDVLVRVRDPELLDGRYVYLNDTDRYAALGATEHDGKLGVVLPEGTFAKISSAVEDDSKDTFSIRLAGDGSASISYRRYFCSNYADQKKVFSILMPEERRRVFDQQIAPHLFSPAAELEGEFLTDFSRYPGVMSFAARDQNFGVRQGDFLLFSLPEVSGLVDKLPEDRLNPWYIEEADKGSLEIEVELPPGFEVVYRPESLEQKEVAGAPVNVDFQLKEERGPDGARRLLLNYTVDMEPAIVKPSAYQKIQKLFQYLGSRKADTVLLTKTASPKVNSNR